MRTGKSILELGQVALKSPEGKRDAHHLLSNSADECRLIHSLDLPELFWSCILSEISLNCINCHVFVSTKMFITQWCFGWVFWLLFLFLYSFIKYVTMEILNKVLPHLSFNIYTELFLVSPALMLGGLNSLTISHRGRQQKPVPSQGFCWGSKSACRVGFFCPFGRVTTAWGPLCGECQEFHGICILDRIVAPKILLSGCHFHWGHYIICYYLGDLMPLVIVIGMVMRFFTTTTTCLLQKSLWCMCSPHSSCEASGVHYLLSWPE